MAAIARGKKIVILAGPNGAGKTTFAQEFLRREGDCPIFVNADLIRRFRVGWRNFEQVYKALVDAWVLYDNSGDAPVRVGAGGRE